MTSSSHLPRLVISAAHKSSGKTMLTLGLAAAFRKRGLIVQPFKKGPDYIDPLWHSAAAGRTCRNLDFYTMPAEEIVQLFLRGAKGADINLIEGNKGLHDGVALDGSNATAALAKLLKSPVVLIIDTRGMTRGVAPLLLGYKAFDPEVQIAGVILNQVGGPRHESKLRAAIENYTDIPVLGGVQRHPEMAVAERHLGLVPANEAAHSISVIDAAARRIMAEVDLDRLLTIAEAAPDLEVESIRPPPAKPADLRIGIAKDSAFGFYYADDLEALAETGVELIPFDTLSDPHLPVGLDGIFIGGGFPETHMEALAANNSLKAEIRQAIDKGMPVYAECGGLMYLSRGILWNGKRAPMVGALPCDTVMHERPQGKGYVRLYETGEGPWPGCCGPIVGHEFHHSSIENIDPGVKFAYRVERGHGIDGKHDGLVWKNVVAGYIHLRAVGGNTWPQRFATFVRACRNGAGGLPSCR